MKGYILRSEHETIAVIQTVTNVKVNEKGDLLTLSDNEFLDKLWRAVSEHYCCTNAEVKMEKVFALSSRNGIGEWFDIETIEDGELSVRSHTLQEIVIY